MFGVTRLLLVDWEGNLSAVNGHNGLRENIWEHRAKEYLSILRTNPWASFITLDE